jgi:hypothetical protein
MRARRGAHHRFPESWKSVLFTPVREQSGHYRSARNRTMKALCVASFCILALPTSSFAASVTVADTTAALPKIADGTAALLLDAGLKVQNAGGGKYTVELNNFHCDERNNGALDSSDVHAGLETVACKINSENQKGTSVGKPFRDQRALRDLLEKIQDSTVNGGTVFTDCAMGYCGTFAKSITCTIDTNIQEFDNSGRWSCTYVDGY